LASNYVETPGNLLIPGKRAAAAEGVEKNRTTTLNKIVKRIQQIKSKNGEEMQS